VKATNTTNMTIAEMFSGCFCTAPVNASAAQRDGAKAARPNAADRRPIIAVPP
nr:hypothetical protein [Tanacetum cinerariifolium]